MFCEPNFGDDVKYVSSPARFKFRAREARETRHSSNIDELVIHGLIVEMRTMLVLSLLSVASALVGPSPRAAVRGVAAGAAPLPLPTEAASPSIARALGASYAAAAPRSRDFPALSATEARTLARDRYVERRSRSGRVGSAFVIVDTDVAPAAAWAALTDLPSWATRMRGVRAARVRQVRGDGAVRAAFSVTKLRLPANLVFAEVGDPGDPGGGGGRVLSFSLDRACANIALEAVDGAWRVEPRAGGGSRVTLAAEIGACKIVPSNAVDYVASKALRRATEWLR